MKNLNIYLEGLFDADDAFDQAEKQLDFAKNLIKVDHFEIKGDTLVLYPESKHQDIEVRNLDVFKNGGIKTIFVKQSYVNFFDSEYKDINLESDKGYNSIALFGDGGKLKLIQNCDINSRKLVIYCANILTIKNSTMSAPSICAYNCKEMKLNNVKFVCNELNIETQRRGSSALYDRLNYFMHEYHTNMGEKDHLKDWYKNRDFDEVLPGINNSEIESVVTIKTPNWSVHFSKNQDTWRQYINSDPPKTKDGWYVTLEWI